MNKHWIIGSLALLMALATMSVAYADSPIEGRAGRAEVRFLEGMIDHHQMALDMANDCLKKAKTEAVTNLCNNIITAQSGEIKTMQEWLLNWYKVTYAPVPMTAMSGMAGMDMGNSTSTVTDPPQMMGMMAGLAQLEGTEYEIAWLESMIDHHDDAIHMAERILKRGKHQELLDLAKKIVTDQTAEIEQMETLLTELSK